MWWEIWQKKIVFNSIISNLENFQLKKFQLISAVVLTQEKKKSQTSLWTGVNSKNLITHHDKLHLSLAWISA